MPFDQQYICNIKVIPALSFRRLFDFYLEDSVMVYGDGSIYKKNWVMLQKNLA